jgi:hypothetical protein
VRRSREDAFAFGSSGEELVRRLLVTSGEYVFPASLFTGKGAPMLEGQKDKIISPDILSAAAGHTRLVEVKTKTTSTVHRNTGVRESGIEERLVEHYLAYQKASGLPCWMIFIHLEQDEVLTQRLDYLCKESRLARDPGTVQSYGGPMRFFRCDAFDLLARLSELTLDSPLTIEARKRQASSLLRAHELAAKFWGMDPDEVQQPSDRWALGVLQSGGYQLVPNALGAWVLHSTTPSATARTVLMLNKWLACRSDAAVEWANAQKGQQRWRDLAERRDGVHDRVGCPLDPPQSPTLAADYPEAAE